MDRRTTELVAIGASITANCQPCLECHLREARQHGADEQDISDSIAVGQMVRKGAAAKFDGFVETALAAAPPAGRQCAGSACD